MLKKRRSRKGRKFFANTAKAKVDAKIKEVKENRWKREELQKRIAIYKKEAAEKLKEKLKGQINFMKKNKDELPTFRFIETIKEQRVCLKSLCVNIFKVEKAKTHREEVKKNKEQLDRTWHTEMLNKFELYEMKREKAEETKRLLPIRKKIEKLKTFWLPVILLGKMHYKFDAVIKVCITLIVKLNCEGAK